MIADAYSSTIFMETSKKGTFTHTVRPGETLHMIMKKYYNLSTFQSKKLTNSIVEKNLHAFRNKNPHFIYAKATLILPSSNNINFSSSSNSEKDDIYYFSR
jgi:nucleoid-associated protein YgaU